MAHKFTNRLIHSASPYLLQHAHNPVDWYEWGPEALAKAKDEDKPILVSIGYSSCHWCHVMERESFENEAVAKLMNDHYVCIKVDREERPDIDQVYMDAVQALGVHGGWPLNVVLTPEQKPFFGGTYFSPPAWTQVLQNIDRAFHHNRDNIENTAEELRLHLLRSDVERFRQPAGDTTLAADLEAMYRKLEPAFDTTWGGLDKAPKFVMPSIWLWLLRYHHLTHNTAALDHTVLTLKRIAMGGIYDQVGGGFARYSVDGYWFVPHFEKMLYDNAQLLALYSEAYAVTRNEEFKAVVYETFGWLQREMTGDHGGFYSALDADSEGVEGKFYCWTLAELEAVLGKTDAALVASYYTVTPQGNWEHGNNILIRGKADASFLAEHNLSREQWETRLTAFKQKLLHTRAERIRPGLDDKVITAWNAMMDVGLLTAYRVFGDARFLDATIKNLRFLEKELTGDQSLIRSYKNKPSAVHAFLDDYAYVIQAYTHLYQVTFDESWLRKAEALTRYTLANFYDNADGFFHYASQQAEKLIATKKELFDNVIPASNAVMAQNLFNLGTLLDEPIWTALAQRMTSDLSHLIKSEPNYMSHWAIVLSEIRHTLAEVSIVGTHVHQLRAELHTAYNPYTITLGTTGKSNLSLLKDRPVAPGMDTSIYVCYNKTCQAPVANTAEALQLLTGFTL